MNQHHMGNQAQHYSQQHQYHQQPQSPYQKEPTKSNPLQTLSAGILGFIIAGVMVLALVLGLILGSLSGNNDDVYIPGDEETSEQTHQEPSIDNNENTNEITRDYSKWDEDYLSAVRDSLPGNQTISDSEILSIPPLVCEGLDDGKSMNSLTVELGQIYDEFTTGFFISSTVNLYCTEHMDKFNAWVVEMERQLGITEGDENSYDVTIENAMVDGVRSNIPELDSLSDEDLVSTAKTLCLRFNVEEPSITVVQDIARELDEDPMIILLITVSATSYVCPQHHGATMEMIDSIEEDDSTQVNDTYREQDSSTIIEA